MLQWKQLKSGNKFKSPKQLAFEEEQAAIQNVLANGKIEVAEPGFFNPSFGPHIEPENEFYDETQEEETEVVFKLNEDEYIAELLEYVKRTYSAHYNKSHRQTIESIMDRGHGEGFCLGNIMKYAERYGFKDGRNRQDLLKIAHYALLALIDYDKNTMTP